MNDRKRCVHCRHVLPPTRVKNQRYCKQNACQRARKARCNARRWQPMRTIKSIKRMPLKSGADKIRITGVNIEIDIQSI